MGYSISLSENQKYIICRVTGKITLETAREFTKELDQRSRSLKIKRFLTDVRHAQNALSTFEKYNFAYGDMAKMDLQRDVRSAILAAESDRTHDFVGTVTRNAGYGVRVFYEEEAAIEWLNE
jgi:hypothetical protein